MQAGRRKALMALGAFALAGCSSSPERGFEPPSVLLTSFGLMPSDGRAPRFAIGLRIINPNRSPLRVRGLAYSVELEGQRMLTGVTSRLGLVPPYGESEIELNAVIDLVSSVRFFNQLISEPNRDQLKYNFRARLDVDGMLAPITLEEKGELVFSQSDAR